MDAREELRDELIAVLGATREIPPDADKLLAEAFLQRVERELPARSKDRRPAGSEKGKSFKLVRYFSLAVLTVLVVGPALAFAAKGFVVHLVGNGSYMLALLLLILGVALSAYLEHHAVQIRITQRKGLGSS